MTRLRRFVRPPPVRPLGAAVLALSALVALPGCAPLLVGGAMVGGVLVATDRRTSGAVVEDQSIEIKAANRVRELATLGHVNATSYNRVLLLTGEVPDAAERERVERALAGIENLRSIVNELAVAGNSSLTSRSNDTLLTTQVKASMVDAKDIFANAIKVVTERGIVYLMGRVTEREANRAADIARGVGGVTKVVKVFEIVTEAELAELQPKPAAAPPPGKP
jgi:osmotically-inducible protein OsmY